MMAKLMAVLVRHEKARGELAMARIARRHVVRVEVNRKRGRSSGEGK
jgi:hypothetical protein